MHKNDSHSLAAVGFYFLISFGLLMAFALSPVFIPILLISSISLFALGIVSTVSIAMAANDIQSVIDRMEGEQKNIVSSTQTPSSSNSSDVNLQPMYPSPINNSQMQSNGVAALQPVFPHPNGNPEKTASISESLVTLTPQ